MLVLVLSVVGLILINLFYRRNQDKNYSSVRYSLALLLIIGVSIVLFILTIPVNDETQNRLLALVGFLLTIVMAFSSTSFVANAMAGFMLRGVNNFKLGDFLRVGEQFGRVTERGFFHTEIQTENRDLTTLPNIYLVSQPVTVVRSSGTVISAEVSLGYDVPVESTKRLLAQAAVDVELADPFVHIIELGDYSVLYRVSGFLEDVKRLISARSDLRIAMIDALHAADIEIVSPRYINQRQLNPLEKVVAEPEVAMFAAKPESAAEDIVFDKADSAERAEQLSARSRGIQQQLQELEAQLKTSDEHSRTALEGRIAVLQHQFNDIARQLEALSDQLDD
ncbi:mechanosensitive ion channel [bacterium]|nr:mechanosensitive ion channel [bacterium]